MVRLLFLKFVFVLMIPSKLFAQTTATNGEEENEIFLLKNQIIQQNEWVQIYPNPSLGELTIVSELTAEVFIVSESGNYIKNITLSENEAQILELPKGNYVVNVKSGDRIIPKRIIVN